MYPKSEKGMAGLLFAAVVKGRGGEFENTLVLKERKKINPETYHTPELKAAKTLPFFFSNPFFHPRSSLNVDVIKF